MRSLLLSIVLCLLGCYCESSTESVPECGSTEISQECLDPQNEGSPCCLGPGPVLGVCHDFECQSEEAPAMAGEVYVPDPKWPTEWKRRVSNDRPSAANLNITSNEPTIDALEYLKDKLDGKYQLVGCFQDTSTVDPVSYIGVVGTTYDVIPALSGLNPFLNVFSLETGDVLTIDITGRYLGQCVAAREPAYVRARLWQDTLGLNLATDLPETEIIYYARPAADPNNDPQHASMISTFEITNAGDARVELWAKATSPGSKSGVGPNDRLTFRVCVYRQF